MTSRSEYHSSAGRDPFVACAMGAVVGTTHDLKFGFNMDLGTTVETIWSPGGTYVYPDDAGDTLEAVSTEVGDVGTLYFQGLQGETFLFQETEITLNGTTPVQLPSTWARGCRMINRSSVEFTGDVHVRRVSDATIFAEIPAGDNQSQMLVCTVPAGKRAFVLEASADIGFSTVAASAEVKLRVRDFGGVFRTVLPLVAQLGGTSAPSFTPLIPLGPYPERTDLQMTARSSNPNVVVSGRMQIMYVDT